MSALQDEPLAVYEWTDERGIVMRLPAETRPSGPAAQARLQSVWRRFEADLFIVALLLLGGFGVGYFLKVFAVT